MLLCWRVFAAAFATGWVNINFKAAVALGRCVPDSLSLSSCQERGLSNTGFRHRLHLQDNELCHCGGQGDFLVLPRLL